MKKNIASRLWCSLLGSLLFAPAYAQLNSQAVQAALKSSDPAPIISLKGSDVKVDVRVQRSFVQLFKNARMSYWKSFTNEKGVLNTYVVRFKTGDRAALALFTKNGKMLHSVLYGTEAHLPAQEKSLLKDYYKDYQITYVHEVTISAEKLWIVSMRNCVDYVKVRIMNGEMDEIQRYKRLE